MKKLEVATNCAVLIVALLACFIMTKRYILPPAVKPDTASLASGTNTLESNSRVGQKVTIAGVTFAHSKPTIVMALATYCHYCVDSATFYQQLSDLKHSGKIKADFVAVFPEGVPQATAFAADHHFSPDQIVSSSLDTIGVSGTPTLLLVDPDGRVKNQWVGKLSEARQKEVLDMLQSATL